MSINVASQPWRGWCIACNSLKKSACCIILATEWSACNVCVFMCVPWQSDKWIKEIIVELSSPKWVTFTYREVSTSWYSLQAASHLFVYSKKPFMSARWCSIYSSDFQTCCDSHSFFKFTSVVMKLSQWKVGGQKLKTAASVRRLKVPERARLLYPSDV